MSDVGLPERATQKRLMKVFEDNLGYENLGDWQYRDGNSNVEEEILSNWLSSQGHDDYIINKVLMELDNVKVVGGGMKLYYANQKVYNLLRYGIKVQAEIDQYYQTVMLIDWEHPENNNFAVAEEVTIAGNPYEKRPDIVIYVNGIALGVIELKSSRVGLSEGIRQNLTNQKKQFIQHFFSTVQLVFAGNDTEGLRYGVIETKEQFYMRWKDEDEEDDNENPLHLAVTQMCDKARFLEIIHDFIVFDAGIKKTCRTNQYFGVIAAQERMVNREGGIIWHTQGSGKSLTMVWLAKWLLSEVPGSRVVILTDRTELDEQIEKVFKGVEENIYRTSSGQDLIDTLNSNAVRLVCSLIHKFGTEDDEYKLPTNFSAKGEIFVFIDECHRTQSGKMHRAMKEILSEEATMIGFTGTPLMKSDKKTSLETFGKYIHKYKYNEAVDDKVILDLRYEPRSVEQKLANPAKVDEWFETHTQNLNDVAKARLKRKWGTMQKVFSSEPRLKIIANEILHDLNTKPRLADGKGNAMLVASGIPEACRYYKIFRETLGGKCAIVTSYEPHISDIKNEDSGEGDTQDVMKHDVYCQMLADWFDEPKESAKNKVEEFEKAVKKRFVEEPGKMKLLIVVDKLLTGFDAPKATYLYIDKRMQDHGLFQAICRVNRIDDESKTHGYIVDYKDLFNSIEVAFNDYTTDAFDGYEKEDVEGLLKNRLEQVEKKLDDTLEKIRALCEPVDKPKGIIQYKQYFCGADLGDEEAVTDDQAKRVKFYKLTRGLIRAYAEVAADMSSMDYSESEAIELKKEVEHYKNAYEVIELASADNEGLKSFEPHMRRLIDNYIRAEEGENLASFSDLSLIELLVKDENTAFDAMPEAIRNNPELIAEVIRSNVRRLIIDRQSVNPAYYDKMSSILNDLIEQANSDALDYQQYLKKLKELAVKVVDSQSGTSYPPPIKTKAQRALYDNLDQDEELALWIDEAILNSKQDEWKGNRIKRMYVRNAIESVLADGSDKVDLILKIAVKQSDY